MRRALNTPQLNFVGSVHDLHEQNTCLLNVLLWKTGKKSYAWFTSSQNLNSHPSKTSVKKATSSKGSPTKQRKPLNLFQLNIALTLMKSCNRTMQILWTGCRIDSHKVGFEMFNILQCKLPYIPVKLPSLWGISSLNHDTQNGKPNCCVTMVAKNCFVL
jgi:hypothetical protein